MLIARIRKILPLGLLLIAGGVGVSAAEPTSAHHAKKHSSTHTGHASATASASGKHHASAHESGHAQGSRSKAGVRHVHSKRRPRSARSIARSHTLQQAFVASSQLRPMAQQLATLRSPGAYAGVAAYASSHSGEAASAAHLALGHAYLLDHRYPEAIENLQKALTEGNTLDDYAEFLIAQAEMQGGRAAEAEEVLTGFAAKYPASIFVTGLPVLIANLSLQQQDPQTALRVLRAHAAEPIAEHADFQLALAKANQLAGNTAEAARLYRHLYLSYPLRVEGQQAKAQLAIAGGPSSLTAAERRVHADALYDGGRYADAADEYRALAVDLGGSDVQAKNALLVAAAACDFKLKRLSMQQLQTLPDTQDESGARRLYLWMELARNSNDGVTQSALVQQMEQRFPNSTWLAEALYSSGNMYLLLKDYPQAIQYYEELAKRFPAHHYAASSHWKAAWLNYRLGNYSNAAQLMDVQIARYPDSKETPAALYWRARLYELQERQPAIAAAYYQTLANAYEHYYYAQVARDRLAALGRLAPASVPSLAGIHREEIPALTDDIPEDDEHVVKARLLANAGLNEYIPAEIQAADGSAEWGAFAEAEIYASYGEAFRAMRVLKRAIPFYASAPIDALPMAYWKILFPQPYWGTIQAEAAKNGLDPYMVASLIRQESEFNPDAISRANALGLMQMLPSVGRSMARQEGIRQLSDSDLLNPDTNIRLGTRYLSQVLAKFDGRPEYTFAAYNAGDNRVMDWKSSGKYTGIDEFVESIPFTETRDYVQAILRNESIYRQMNQHVLSPASGRAANAPEQGTAPVQ